jgi:serine/threonine-protein kinase RsbW
MAQWTWQHECSIPSECNAGRAVIELLLKRLEALNWTRRDLFSIRLAMEEALVNAVEHGNQLDADKRVHIVCRISDAAAFIQITDEGPGFDPRAVPDPTDEDRLECPGGRGVMLMRNFMTEVVFNESGNQVTLVKKKGGSP